VKLTQSCRYVDAVDTSDSKHEVVSGTFDFIVICGELNLHH